MSDFTSFITGGSASSKKPIYSVEDVQNMVYGQESDFGKADTSKPNYAGAIGPGQILPGTWESGKKQGLIPQNYDINNPKHNLEGSKALIADAYKRYEGDADKVLAEYYAGPKVIKDGQIQTHWKDLKNAKAPNVGQYIEQAKAKFHNMGDDFSKFIMGNASSKTEDTSTTQQTQEKKTALNEFIKPLSEISSEDWREKSLLAPAIEYTASSLGVPGFTEADKKAAQEKLVKKGKGFVEGVTKLVTEPVTTISDIAKGIYENPAKFAGETVKGLIYDPEQLVAVPGAGKVMEKVGEVGSKAKKAITGTTEASNVPVGASIGAAQTSNATILKDAINRAQSPELKAELSNLKAKDINPEVLERRLEADTLPVPIKLTKGQATQNPTLISRERNERGFKEPLVEHFNQQNKALAENVTLMKERVAPDVFTESHVADSQGAIANIEAKAKANADATKAAYEDLKNAAGGQFPIDGKTFADNAISVLSKEDRMDYLPANIAKKLEEYSSGKKQMNFNLFENLRSDLAADIRKAQRSGDGTQAYVLGQVRSELEKLPLVGETADLKALADKARGLAKADFDLERTNKIYSDVVNGKADTKNFISKNVINSTNKDFAETMSLVADDPIAKQHLASGTLDLIIRDSTDASGNFLTGKFAKHINNLDLNGKLVPLFGQEAKTLQQIAKTGQYIEARPKGAFVNESNTLTGALAENAKSAIEHGTNIAFKGIPVGTVGRKMLQKRALNKELEETLSPTGGVKLKDIGK